MPIARVQAVFSGDSGLPRDVYVNTLHFDSLTPIVGTAPGLAQTVEDFYGVDAGSGDSIRDFLSVDLSGLLTIRIYDLSTPPPRVPVLVTTDAAGTSGTALPEEVACCLSYQAAALSGQPQRRRRGRIFIGPLSDSARVGSGPAQNRPSAAFIAVLADKAQTLITQTAGVTPWVVHSEVGAGSDAVVTNGWVDNAFDTQRRRGFTPTARTLW